MKKIFAALLLLSSSQAFAAGSFTCTSADKKIVVTGTDSSMGSAVRTLTIDGVEQHKGEAFESSEMYNSTRSFSFKLVDGDYNGTILQVETVKAYPLASGLVWLDDKEPQPIVCEFEY